MRQRGDRLRWRQLWCFAALTLFGVYPITVFAAPPAGAEPAVKRDEVEDARVPAEAISRLIRIERVEIHGLQQVARRQVQQTLAREGLVRGADLIWPEDVRVRRVRDRLRDTGYFKSVTLSLIPVPGSDDAAVLVVEVSERSTVAVDHVYLGSSALTPFRGGLSLAERNFLGRGVLLGGAFVWSSIPQVQRGRRQQSYKLFAEAPELPESDLGVLGGAWVISAGEPYRVSGSPSDPNPAQFRSFDYTRVGGVVGLNFPVLRHLEIGVDYRFERIDTRLPTAPTYISAQGEESEVDLGILDDAHRLTVANFGLTYDGRSQSALTGKGTQVGLDLQVSSPGIGSQYEYIKVVVLGAYTFRLPWRHWLTPRVQGGQIVGDAPRFEQFYSGDLSAWTPGREQGLRFSTRNPIDVFGSGIDERTFGTSFARFDLEYVWPVFRRTRTRGVYGGDLFWSAGVFTLAENAEGRAARRDAGEAIAPAGFNADFGLRLDTALGTMKLTVGSALQRVPL